MAQRTWTNVTLRATGTFAPNAQGWDVSALPEISSVSAQATLQTADLNDATLTLDVSVEFTNDPTGASGWNLIVGGIWQGGPNGRAQIPRQPAFGPYTTTNWPPLQRLRFRATPSRDLPGVDGAINAF